MRTQPASELHLQKKSGLSEELAEILLRRVEAGDFRIGDVMPPEKVFAETYQVSRTVVREALARLKYEGIIVSRRGSGSAVVSTTPQKSLKLDSLGNITSFFEFRMLMDSEAAAMAAVRHTKEQIERLKVYLDQLDDTNSGHGNHADPDYRFHALIAEASDNKYIQAATQQLSTKTWNHLYAAKLRPCGHQVHAEHSQMFKAIAARDPSEARAASVTHLVASAARCGIELDVRHLVWRPDSLSFL